MEQKAYHAHETSVIDEPVTIGNNTKIWHFSHVMSGADIGSNCNLGQNVYVGGKAKIGNGVRIQNNVSVYDGVTLEDDVFCGPSMVFTNDPNPRSAYPKHGDYLQTIVKRGASIGANVTVVCGTTIGTCAFIGAGSVVTKDVPDYALAYGTPARVHGWVCECGEKLQFDDEKAQCSACAKKYSISENSKVIQIP